ncbi:MAG: hypothetical protein J7L15_04025 [Clostridiales bacterium]|nr:hypothetical protein [Clostridiales bacterium]
MAMEEILDSVRRIVHKWVNTITPVTQNIAIGNTSIIVYNTRRFQPGDEVMLKDANVYETGLSIKSIDSDTEITLDSAILNNWTVAQNTQLVKTINEQFVQAVYLGDPEVIPRFPAVTVNGLSRSSEWMTLESTKERYEIEIGVYVLESTLEAGYRFLMQMTDVIQKGLKQNIVPLVEDYEIVSLTNDISVGDVNISLNVESDIFNYYRQLIIEDEYNTQEVWVDQVYIDNPSGETRVHLADPVCFNLSASDTSVIIPRRFVFNSWPSQIEYGKIHKGSLLKASSIKWFAEEAEIQFFRRWESKLK